MAKQLEVLLLCFCIGGCFAGVVPSSFKKRNDLFSLTLDQSDVENVARDDDVQISSTEIPEVKPLIVSDEVESPSNDSSIDLLNLNGTKISTEIDLGNATFSSESFNFTRNASEGFEELLDEFVPQKSGRMFNEGNDSTDISTFNETVSVLILNEFINNTANESTTDNITDFGFTGNNSSIREISNETEGFLGNDWSQRNSNETIIDDLRIQFNESNSNETLPLSANETLPLSANETLPLSANETLPLSANETENSPIMDFAMAINDTIEEISSALNLSNIAANISSELENQSSLNASEGIFSNLGFEFLKNSEVAKNAALAMEVFNFTDSSLTDHIIEDNEFHGFLDPVIPTLVDSDILNSTLIQVVELNSTNGNSNSSEGIEEFGTFEDGPVPLLNGENSTFNDTELMETETDAPGLLLNLTEFVNETLQLINLTDFTGEMNETLISNISTISNDKDFIESIVTESDFDNDTIIVPQCPPPGICIFWFLSQDTCAVDSHCLGSRICCRIRCSKTCIEA